MPGISAVSPPIKAHPANSQPVAIPPTIGLDVDEAEQALTDAGFVVGGVRGNTALPVLFTTPPAGELHLPGTEVIIFTETPE